jgi:putative molybdopterin biosynthesis protein
MKPNIYLENTPLDEALRVWTEALTQHGVWKPLESQQVKVIDSLGRITAEPVFAEISSPFYHSSAMDGYAVKFTETFGASEKTPIRLNVPEQAVYIATGNPLPEGYDAVIMVEDVHVIRAKKTEPAYRTGRHRAQTIEKKEHPFEDEMIEIIKPATPWQHVRTVGEDIVATELIIPENHRIRPVDIGALLSGGHTGIRVRRRPRVVIIPTGSELIEPGVQPVKGNIIESNSRILSELVREWGGEPVRWHIVPDDKDELEKALLEAASSGDLIVVNAGASAGKKDYTSHVIRSAGEIILHGVNIKPGKPVILGWVKNRPVLGIPGYPVSAYVTFELFAKPVINIWQGLEVPEKKSVIAKMSRQVHSSLGTEEFIRVKVGKVGENIVASPVSRGAGMLMSLVRADGFVRIPAMSEGVGVSAEVEVKLFGKTMDDITETIVCIGSHDNIIDVLALFLKKRYPRFSLSSAHVGSLGGLISLKRGEAHVAGTHLLDEDSGEYNVPFIQRFIPDEKIILINLVYRQQGLYVLKGNPKNITGFRDLVRDDIVFINRQPGSGTRLLTDKYLQDSGIQPENIQGYEREEYTHMTVASAVLNGIADTGLGILAAAEALGLDFIPLASERYDIALPERFMGMEMIQNLLHIIRNDKEFSDAVKNLGGYDVSDMGKVVFSSPGSGSEHVWISHNIVE